MQGLFQNKMPGQPHTVSGAIVVDLLHEILREQLGDKKPEADPRGLEIADRIKERGQNIQNFSGSVKLHGMPLREICGSSVKKPSKRVP